MKNLFAETVLALACAILFARDVTAQVLGSPESIYDCAGIPNGTTQLTDCGCGKPAKATFACKACDDNTSCLDCAGVPFGGRVASGPTGGVPSSDPCTLVCPSSLILYPPENRCITKEDACSRVDANLINVGLYSFHPKAEPITNTTKAIFTRNGAFFSTFASVDLESSCIGSALRQCLPAGQVLEYMLEARRQSGNNNDADKCVGDILRSWGVSQGAQWVGTLFEVDTEISSGFAFVSRATSQGCGPASQDLISLAQRAGCRVREIDVVEFSSPVSLLWSEGVEIDTVLSFSRFPLGGKNEGQTYQWRGSSITPLVVYDSRGFGEITGANQLFGNHTFGKEWRNGYEALASLDIDKSGWLEGEELNAVALWFDFDQDGVSQKGEVKRLSETGIFAIGVKGDSVDEKTKNIFASNGFKRRVDGKEVTGRSVDWYGGVAKGELPARAASLQKPNEGGASGVAAAQGAATGEVERIDLRATVSGIWEWHITESAIFPPERQPGGFLAITQEGSSLRGQSVSTVRFLPNMYMIDEKVTSVPFRGTFGQGSVSFKIADSKQTLSSSTAKLSSDGMMLTGTTVQNVPVEGASAQVTYEWQARRLIRAN